MNLNARTALVTGASSGIGRATCIALADRGARVAAVGRDAGALEQLARTTGAATISADLTDAAWIERVAAEADRALGRLDVLVNAAGIGWAGDFAAMDVAAIDDLIATNLLAPILLTRAVLPGMLAREVGHIVNVASIAGHVGVASEAVYASSKAALIGFSESLRYEVAGAGIGVSVVSPGAVATPFFDRRGAPYARTRPKPIAAERVAAAIVDAIERGRDEVVIPRWLGFPIWLRGAWPGLYRALARRLG